MTSIRPLRTQIAVAVGLALAVASIGFILLGPVPAALFALGYVGGLVLWLRRLYELPSFDDIRAPYWATLALFVAHKLEERRMDFFPALAQLTGREIQTHITPLALLLYVLAAAWLLVPMLMRWRVPFGAFLSWSFFCAMGLVELAHFVFPLFRPEPYGYFPGMASAALLAPAAWWGLYSMVHAR